MSERLIIINAYPQRIKALQMIGVEAGALDCQIYPTPDNNARQTLHLLVGSARRQEILDKIQSSLAGTDDWKITILPVEASIPRAEEAVAKDKNEPKWMGETREELYNDVIRNTQIDRTFLFFVITSTLVAALGLLKDNVAVVIGAMVIAPLLGPNLAFALGGALGDYRLMARAMGANAIGVGITILISVAIGFAWPVALDSHELMSRTSVGLDGIAVALASGAAATLSLTVGVSAALVGVMVAVALMPPAAAMGMLFGAGEWHLAVGAGTLLAVNVVCVNLSAQAMFVLFGVRPRTWFEKENARRATIMNASIWIVLLGALAVLLLRTPPELFRQAP